MQYCTVVIINPGCQTSSEATKRAPYLYHTVPYLLRGSSFKREMAVNVMHELAAGQNLASEACPAPADPTSKFSLVEQLNEVCTNWESDTHSLALQLIYKVKVEKKEWLASVRKNLSRPSPRASVSFPDGRPLA